MLGTSRPMGVAWGFGLACVCTVLFGAATDAAASSFAVDSTIDAGDANPGDGLCATSIALGSVCTLRAAVEETNALPGADVITVPAGTYKLAMARRNGGDLEIVASEVRICGAGAGLTIIDGGGIDRVFDIRDFSEVTMCKLTIQHGKTAQPGGGIRNFGSRLALTSVSVSANSARFGGGIWNDSQSNLTIVQSLIAGNSALRNGGGIDNDGELDLRLSEIRENSAQSAGGLLNAGTAAIAHSTIRMTVAMPGGGGGLFNFSSLGGMTISNSTISANTAAGAAAIRNGEGELQITNSTISGNHALQGCNIVTQIAVSDVGGIGEEPPPPFACGAGGLENDSSAHLVGVTIAHNTVGPVNGLGADVFGGGVIHGSGATTDVRNSIVSLNSPDNCVVVVNPFNPQPIASLGHNLESANTCGFNAIGDLVNVDPLLGPLHDNGGPTPTHALPPGSAAVNNATACEPHDQRGAFRSASQCDIGAFERSDVLDLSALKTADCYNLVLGAAVSFQIVVSNFGPEAATAVAIDDEVDAGWEVRAVRAGDNLSCRMSTSERGSSVECIVATLRPDSSAEVIVEAVPLLPGLRPNLVVVSSDQRELDESNNQSSVVVNVSR